MRKLFFIFLLLGGVAQAQENLETIEVSHEKQDSFSEYWEENKGTQIFSGKKNTVTDLDEIPALQTNNYRQATSQTPGLLISEIPNEALAAMTYRGLGNPHESYNVLLLQDGIPVAADMYGYPAHYFSPALPMMDKFQFIRGGAGLLYGPQPGGVVNYISEPLLHNQKTNGHVGLTYGSYNLITTNNAVYGSKGDHSYGIEYYRRQGDGPQRINSDFTADYVQLRDHIFKGDTKYKISFNGYNSDHGESGGFAKTDSAGAAVFGDDLGKSTRRHDRLKVSRAQLAGGLEKRLDDASQIDVDLWATAYNRYSKRQRGGGFGTLPTGANASTNDITTQKYYGYNGQVRYLRNYNAFENEHTFTAGYLNYNLISPIHTERGTRADANTGATQSRLDRETHVNSFFVENRFTFGKFMATPGVRFENITQSVDERTGTERERERTASVPLFGLGLSYHLTENSQLYGNISEAYKPFTYSEALPTSAGQTVASDIKPSEVWNYELGYRGQTDKLNWDVSAFYIRYENQIGTSNNQIINTGAGTHKGFDVATEVKLSTMSDFLKKYGEFNFYTNFALLDAQYTQGPNEGKTPQYAPKTITRAGLIYEKEDKLNVAFMGVFVGEHFGNDTNTDQFEIPSYTVFDLTADWTFHKHWVAHAGINNLFDREYYSRVRNEGVIWALDRNYYAGVTYQF
ncbi:MAG: TonB-dependent receptor family protein [Bacteriovoracia bacterium]